VADIGRHGFAGTPGGNSREVVRPVSHMALKFEPRAPRGAFG